MFFSKVLDFLLDQRFPWMFWRLFQRKIGQPFEKKGFNKIYVCLTFDVEQDNGSAGEGSLNKTASFLNQISRILKNKKATFFIQGNLISTFSKQLKLLNKDHELGLHGFTHQGLWGEPVWFLKEKSLVKKAKDKALELSLKSFSKNNLAKPRSFRAPNMIINRESLKLLKDYKFLVDSSFSSFRKFSQTYKIGKIWEIPVSSLSRPLLRLKWGIPNLDFQVLNIANLKRLKTSTWQKNIDLMLTSSSLPHLVFLGHSWDFDKKVFADFIKYLEDTWKVEYVTMEELTKRM